ncbi:uroporphyrinogen decarboxylase family protein [Geomesophilobacter sediminis]|uniref:Uroporphyrinogen decarboxylase (URO-D) domain-containing protein n=1 Tax=Geomesophilobacter sediminis TaxID=2798584 RepID=A0A8J7LU79_9BACT|nr:uroporphyrinogen decarboxylase family protein [Geomesophilobacter sediminis]MBJ6724349.1 hypothetical protein [Geomesophilobacter sediminis]
MVDLAEAKTVIGTKAVLVGNVRPTESMYLETPETVAENARQCLRDGGDAAGGFVLAVGCGLPIPAPPANVHALVEVARNWQPGRAGTKYHG